MFKCAPLWDYLKKGIIAMIDTIEKNPIARCLEAMLAASEKNKDAPVAKASMDRLENIRDVWSYHVGLRYFERSFIESLIVGSDVLNWAWFIHSDASKIYLKEIRPIFSEIHRQIMIKAQKQAPRIAKDKQVEAGATSFALELFSPGEE